MNNLVIVQPQFGNSQYQQTPLFVVNTTQLQVQVPNPNPESFYCNAVQREISEDCNIQISQNDIKNALNQVQGELNLKYTSLDLIGNRSILSLGDLEENIIKPIIQENKDIPSSRIRCGKVVYCCNYLSAIIRKQGMFQICSSLFSIMVHITVYILVTQSPRNIFGILLLQQTAYIVQILLSIIEFIFTFICLLRCYHNILQCVGLLNFLNLLYGISLLILTGIVGSKTRFEKDEDPYFIIFLVSKILLSLIIYFKLYSIESLNFCWVRLFVLLKQYNESELFKTINRN